MCPDRELLSAYFDGEVPSPWKERIARHLESCPACASSLERFSSLAAGLREPAAEGAVSEAAIRVRSRLAARLGQAFSEAPAEGVSEGAPGEAREAERAGQAPKRGLPRLWNRELSMPLPLAAAAALVIALCAALASALYLHPEREALRALAATEIAPSAQNASFEDILRYLESQDAQATLTIRLPSSATFDAPGQPVIMRAAPRPETQSTAQKGTKP